MVPLSDKIRQENAAVMRKFFLFSAAMFIVPIGSYFLARETIFKGRHDAPNMSGYVALAMVQVVIGAYIWMAFNEDESDLPDREANKKES
jgi:hypothetical protein